MWMTFLLLGSSLLEGNCREGEMFTLPRSKEMHFEKQLEGNPKHLGLLNIFD